MPFSVRSVLLVASPYDCFNLEEEGRFSDRLLGQYLELDLTGSPHFDHVTTGKTALRRLKQRYYDLVLSTPHCSDMSPATLAERIRDAHPHTSVVMLTYDRAEALTFSQRESLETFPPVFLWTGDPKLLVAIVKTTEDRKNADHDTREGQVRVIIAVDDSPEHYSAFLPAMYREIMHQVQSLLPQGLNDRDRACRLQLRPKILLARTFEEAKQLFRQYRRFLLGVICDLHFPQVGQVRREAGIRFARLLRRTAPKLPILLHSRHDYSQRASELNLAFVNKRSPDWIEEICRFMRRNFGFGPFIFRMPDGTQVGRAVTLEDMMEALPQIPDASLRYHAEGDGFSNWFMARSEFSLAAEVRPRQVDEFRSLDDVRGFLLSTLNRFVEDRQRGQITDFSSSSRVLARDFTRIGSGSMGGKARSIAFMSSVLADNPVHERFPELHILVPRTAVICTDYFDRFCEQHQLRHRALETQNDDDVVDLFLSHPLDPELLSMLERIVRQVDYPLAVRSSSLLEDSQFQPMAGLYKTYMLPNCSQHITRRLEQLSQAVRTIWASTFFGHARTFLESHSLRLEEERMAVIIQRLIGRRHGHRFYPDFAGVAQSYNYYPVRHLKAEDGIVTVALGLGHTVSEGGKAIRFCPRHPRILPQMGSPELALRSSMREFFALNLNCSDTWPGLVDNPNLVRCDLDQARKDGTLEAVGATYSPENDVIYDTIHRPGIPIVNFSGVLKHGRFPLAAALEEMLEQGRRGMGMPVEMEFAATMTPNQGASELAILQVRPLMARNQGREVRVEKELLREDLLLAGPALGNGVFGPFLDLVYIHPNRLNLGQSKVVAQEIGRINFSLLKSQRPYILMAPGRLGTADPNLGYPVRWSEVCGAGVIAELELPDLAIDPSQGTHFFHNLTSLGIPFFTIKVGSRDHRVDLTRVEELTPCHDQLGIRHVRLPVAYQARIDGRQGMGVILPVSR